LTRERYPDALWSKESCATAAGKVRRDAPMQSAAYSRLKVLTFMTMEL